MPYYARITRSLDNSAAAASGRPSQVGAVTVSRSFPTEAEASREADAWAHRGEYARFGPSDWTAEVVPGGAPAAPCGIRVCTRITPHTH
jgi:hypothetical protein